MAEQQEQQEQCQVLQDLDASSQNSSFLSQKEVRTNHKTIANTRSKNIRGPCSYCCSCCCSCCYSEFFLHQKLGCTPNQQRPPLNKFQLSSANSLCPLPPPQANLEQNLRPNLGTKFRLSMRFGARRVPSPLLVG